jgi:hypothetical protein
LIEFTENNLQNPNIGQFSLHSSVKSHMKIYLKLDSQSIKSIDIDTIIKNNNKLSCVEDEIFLYSFDPIVFTHAWELLGSDPSRYGTDLTPYLANTISHFRRISNTTNLHLDFGDTDFKRKLSEDLSVSLAAMFMVDSCGIIWHTFTQIPVNRNLSFKRPDFEGFDATNNRYLFEAKGTSALRGVLPAIEKAITQVKTYPENALYKFVIVSYFSGYRRAFPSYTFVLDPQMVDIVPADEEHAIILHYIKVFGNCSGR